MPATIGMGLSWVGQGWPIRLREAARNDAAAAISACVLGGPRNDRSISQATKITTGYLPGSEAYQYGRPPDCFPWMVPGDGLLSDLRCHFASRRCTSTQFMLLLLRCFFYQVTANHHRGCFVRVPSEHIAIIVVVDLASIQSQFDSSSSSATTIADLGHRPIHLIASNPTGVTAIGPALRTVATGPSSCKALACCLQGLGLLHRKLASKAVGCRHDASW